MASGKKSTPLKKVVQDGARGLRNWRRWWLQLTFVLALIILGTTVAFMINPQTSSHWIPVKDEDIGKVAPEDIYAPKDFSVLDEESTERLRQEAEDAVRSVYDFEKELGQERIRRLREAFGEMESLISANREAVELLESQLAKPVEEEETGARKHKRGKTDRGESDEAAEAHKRIEEEIEGLKKGLEEKLDQKRGEFQKILQVVVGEEDFARFKEDRFSAATLASVTKLVDRCMRHMIVQSRELLDADRAKGIIVLYREQGVVKEEMVMMRFSRILDRDEAQEKVDQAALYELSQVPRKLRDSQVRLAKDLVTANLFFNRDETKHRKREARKGVQERKIEIKKDSVIIRARDVIEKSHVKICRAMKKEMSRDTSSAASTQMALGTTLLVILMLGLIARFSTVNIRKFRSKPKDLALLAVMMFILLVSVKLWFWIIGAVFEQLKVFPLESYYYIIPFAAGAMLVRFVLNSEMALAYTAPASLLVGLLMEDYFGVATYCMVSSVVAAGAIGNINQRISLLRAGVVTGLANVVLAIALALFHSRFFTLQTVFDAFFAFSGGIVAAIIVMGVAPVLEVIFGYTTNIKLLELANLNHPLLKDLIVQAPGSYHHSIIVGSMVEAAAEAIHCNPLLARVMAYYHDIGKIKKPDYFSENQRDGTNRHDKLKPSLSAAVLKAHVKDGAELARQSRLGEPIIDAIVQHHGTSLIKFFYQRAKDQAEESETVNEEEFRYPGPKPRSREVALVMLADSVEAAAKSISDPSPARLRGLVQNIINRIFADGQLNDCDLTLKDLNEIARAFNRVLAGIYHYRPDYPESATKDPERKRTTVDKMPAAKKEGEERREAPDEKTEDLGRLGM
ncbi:MAG: HDIG domain-containing protein [Deltaproteobacteria bacterium]|nr:HDIG domain-containing protein [Deltaproteobacteria bacterium]